MLCHAHACSALALRSMYARMAAVTAAWVLHVDAEGVFWPYMLMLHILPLSVLLVLQRGHKHNANDSKCSELGYVSSWQLETYGNWGNKAKDTFYCLATRLAIGNVWQLGEQSKGHILLLSYPACYWKRMAIGGTKQRTYFIA